MSENKREPAGGSVPAALHEAIQGVAWQTDLRSTLSLVAEKARGLTRATSTAIMLLDPSRTLLDFAAVSGVNASEILGQRIRAENTFAGKTALTGELYLSHSLDESLSVAASPHPDLGAVGAVRSAAVVPLYLNGQPAGALAALNRDDNSAFTGKDIFSLQTLANTAALAILVDNLRRAAARKQRERDILFHAAHTTSSSLNVQEVLSSVLATLEDSLDLSSGAIYLLNDERTRLYISAYSGLSVEDSERQLESENGAAAQALSATKAVLSSPLAEQDAEEDPLLPGMRSVLAAPMISRAMPAGVIAIGSRQADAYSPEDADLLTAVASQAAVALENAWLYEDAMRSAQEATALYELSQAIGSTLSLGRMLNFVADSVISLLQVDKFALFLWNPRINSLEVKIGRNLSDEASSCRPQRGEGIAGWVLEFETPTAVQDIAADHRNRSCPIADQDVISVVSVPLQSGDQVIGVLLAMSSRRRLFTVGEMELLYTISNQAGAAIANAQMFEDARQKKDELRKYVRRVARALGSSTSPEGAAQVIIDLAVEMTGADRSALLSALPDGGFLVRASYNLRGAKATDVIAPGERESPSGWIVRRARSLMIEDVSKEKYDLLPYAAKEKVVSYLGVPLKLGKTVLGVLEVYTRESHRFTPDEVRLLITVASQAAVALQTALLVEQAERRVADLDFLSRLSDLLREMPEPSRLLPAVLPLLSEALGAEWARLCWTGLDQPLLYQRGDGAEQLDYEGEGMLKLPLEFAQALDASGELALSRSSGFDSHEKQLAQTAVRLLATRL